MKNEKDEIQTPEVEEISAETINQQITILQKAQIAVVPMANNEFEGLQGTRASKAPEVDLRNTIKVAVIKAHIGLKRSFEKLEIRFVIDQLKDEILRLWPGIRLEEIQLAIHRGAMGNNGKVYALSLAFFVECIRTYMNSDKRLEAGKRLLSKSSTVLLTETTKPTEAEIQKKALEIIMSAFEFYKENGFYRDYGNYVFNSLAKYGVINLSEQDKIAIWKEARYAVSNNFINPTETSIDKRYENMRNYQDVKNNPEHPLIYVEAKKMALNFFFADLRKMETELSDLIEI